MKVHSWNLAANGQGAELVCNKSPFQQGRSALLLINPTSNFNGTVNLQRADDVAGTSWTNYLSGTQLDYMGSGANRGGLAVEIVLGEKVRPTLSGLVGGGEVNVAIAVGA